MGMTPLEAWSGTKPDVSHLREFGCDVWILDEDKNRSKLAPKSKKMIFTGFEDGPKAVRYYDAATRKIKVSQNFAFNKNEEPRLETSSNIPGLPAEGEPAKVTITSHDDGPNPASDQTHKEETGTQPSKTRRFCTRDADIDYQKLHNPQAQPAHRSQPPLAQETSPTEHANLVFEPSQAFMEDFLEKLMEMSFEVISGVEKMLRTAWEALESAEGEQWGVAMDEELARLREMGTWELTEDMPEERVPIGNRWVFMKKKDEHGNTIQYKAWLIAQGFSQKPRTDYSNNGTFALVMRFESLHTAFGMAAINGWDMRQMDVKTAYLNGYLEEEIYMLQPSRFDDGMGRICRLRRLLYGLKQAGNVWNKAWNKAMEELGYEKLKLDYCCFVRREEEDFSIILVWVNDLINFSNDTDRVERELKTKFEINVIGEPSILLGMKIDRDEEKKTISLSQTHYIDSLLKRFSLVNANTVSTPMDPNVNLDEEEDQGEGEKEKIMDERGPETYATAIRSLMYAALATRPDIAYAVQQLAQFTKHPRPKHWTAVKRIFRYLKGIQTHALTFRGSDISWTTELTFFCDADWASNAD